MSRGKFCKVNDSECYQSKITPRRGWSPSQPEQEPDQHLLFDMEVGMKWLREYIQCFSFSRIQKSKLGLQETLMGPDPNFSSKHGHTQYSYTYTCGKKGLIVHSHWSKTTLITSSAHGAGVNPPLRKIKS